MKFETFDAALDEFYSKIETQRAEQQLKAKESSAMQKLNKIRTDQVCITIIDLERLSFTVTCFPIILGFLFYKLAWFPYHFIFPVFSFSFLIFFSYVSFSPMSWM